MVLKRGKKETDDGIMLFDGEMMKDLGDEGYKYLGVLEVSEIKIKEMREKVRSEYIRRVKLLLEFKFNGGNVIKVINIWVVVVLRYFGGIFDWT